MIDQSMWHAAMHRSGTRTNSFAQVKRTIRITTEQHILKDLPPVENFPIRRWSIQISMLDSLGKEISANILDKVTYTLHPTFANPTRTIKTHPFRVEEQGWGEFDIPIAIHLAGLPGKQGERKFNHDLNFLKEKYTVDHVITIPTNKSPTLTKLLQESGPVPNGAGAAADDSSSSKRKNDPTDNSNRLKKAKTANGGAIKGSVDLERLANGLSKLGEDDLIVIVQMVTDNRTTDMNIKNDVEKGEFTMDLYTLPESLLKSMWDYVKKHTGEL